MQLMSWVSIYLQHVQEVKKFLAILEHIQVAHEKYTYIRGMLYISNYKFTFSLIMES